MKYSAQIERERNASAWTFATASSRVDPWPGTPERSMTWASHRPSGSMIVQADLSNPRRSVSPTCAGP